jgi:hypothetical protein
MAKANPWEIKNCAASAAQPITRAEKIMEGKVQTAERALAFAVAALMDLSSESMKDKALDGSSVRFFYSRNIFATEYFWSGYST